MLSDDKVFLFSEIEVMGNAILSYAGEGTKYSIFTNSASRIKKLSNDTGVESSYFTRSPSNQNISTFEGGYPNGIDVAGIPASHAYGVAFGFCV